MSKMCMYHRQVQRVYRACTGRDFYRFLQSNRLEGVVSVLVPYFTVYRRVAKHFDGHTAYCNDCKVSGFAGLMDDSLRGSRNFHL